jgi:protein-L-isoaspartate(D-aspartate) O-methyltransferase
MSDHETERERMVEQLDRKGRIERDATREALRAVPRHEFVPESRRNDAYDDRPLPIGEGQTISAPHMVAMMTDLLALDAGDQVLEIGTGCGYHAAVVAAVVGEVKSVEFYESLAEDARERLSRLGYAVDVRAGDGHEGWPEHAPYDAAYLTCAASEIPDAVAEQVRPGGRIVAPIGERRQTLVRATRRADGGFEREQHGGVRFVSMQSG